MIQKVTTFFRQETAGGVLLLIAVALAMIVKNSPFELWYGALLSTVVKIQVGEIFYIGKPLVLWINDGLMAIFFFYVGLELKREFYHGALSNPAHVRLPVIAAIGGMAMPAIIYSVINWHDAQAMQGWAIPSATDIAFALGVLALLGERVPNSLKIFLMTLAIVDDLGAVIIIALFYTADLSVLSLSIAAGCLLVLSILNRRKVTRLSAYLLVGLVLWTAVLKSGVHATLAGMLIALFIPLHPHQENEQSPLEVLEHDLRPVVNFAILPLFAFANTGIPLSGLSGDTFLHSVPLGIALGLFLGNQIGVFGFSWIAIKLRLAQLPQEITWLQLYGVSLLCGIGFTMSLFISSLAFEQGAQGFAVDNRLGILVGSLLSGVFGYWVLYWAHGYTLSQTNSKPPSAKR